MSRRILCVFPRYTRSFGTLHHAWPLVPGTRAFMPPQGLLVLAGYLRDRGFDVRLVDENLGPATAADFAWAEAVFVSGMHIQKHQIREIGRRAQAAGRFAAVGGPSVSGCPEYYPEFDAVHLGELGDATDELLDRLARSVGRPARQEVYRTKERLPLDRFPVPAYRMLDLSQYFLGSLQFSSGCPYRCDFCDIPALYGRNPRLKSPAQVLRELDELRAAGCRGAVYFVDDNFIGNRKAALDLLPHLVEWQERNGFPFELACEATMNLAAATPVLELMRKAYFTTVFAGIETPETEALQAIQKQQNLRRPLVEAVDTLNRHGLEVVSGIIMGLDTDTDVTPDRILAFIEESRIPMLTINLLYALPKTPLYERLKAEGRLEDDEDGRESNVRFLLPYDTVRRNWLRTVTAAYQPEALYRRFDHQLRHTYPNRIELPNSPARVNPANVRLGLRILGRLLWRLGVTGRYRRTFWRRAWPLLRAGRIEDLIHLGLVGHHLIEFARDCAGGRAESSFYSDRLEAVRQEGLKAS